MIKDAAGFSASPGGSLLPLLPWFDLWHELVWKPNLEPESETEPKFFRHTLALQLLWLNVESWNILKPEVSFLLAAKLSIEGKLAILTRESLHELKKLLLSFEIAP